MSFAHNFLLCSLTFHLSEQSGHMPCVRVWDVAECTQVAEVQCHKYGVACVAFSTNGCYVVSVGFQHDRTVSVWEWKVSLVMTSYKLSTLISGHSTGHLSG